MKMITSKSNMTKNSHIKLIPCSKLIKTKRNLIKNNKKNKFKIAKIVLIITKTIIRKINNV